MLIPFLDENGYELWNVEWSKSGGEKCLIISLDKDGGIGTDDCEKISRYIGTRIDDEDLIETSYQLIVSSPGMDRPLLTDGHFQRYTGRSVDVSLYMAFEGRKKLSGKLLGRDEKNLMLTLDDGTECVVPREIVSKVSLQVII